MHSRLTSALYIFTSTDNWRKIPEEGHDLVLNFITIDYFELELGKTSVYPWLLSVQMNTKDRYSVEIGPLNIYV